MEQAKIAQFLGGKSLFVTGVTGFVGKALVEKVLFSAPDVRRIYVLIRGKGSEGERNAAARLEREVADSPIFGRLRRQHGPLFDRFFREKVVAVGGDLADPRLGLPEEKYQSLASQVDVVINSAAAVSFDERLDLALALNTLGARWVAEFAASASAESFVHVSTCYVSGTRTGDILEVLLDRVEEGSAAPIDAHVDRLIETIQQRCSEIEADSQEPEVRNRFLAEARAELAARGGTIDIPPEDRAEERRRIWVKERMVEEGMRLARRNGWNDTYTFTKVLGENLVARHRAAIPVAIVRPSIIESSYAEPEPGWIEGFRMADPILVAYGKGTLHDFPGDPDVVLDLIPLDHVVNAILAVAAVTREQEDLRVYQVATGDVNPISVGALYENVRNYFATNPMQDALGRAVTPGRWSFPGAKAFRRYYRWRNQIPLAAADRILALFPQTGRVRRHREKIANMTARIEQILYYVKIYAPYTVHGARYRTDNVRSLYATLSEQDRRVFPFDAAAIDWKRYVTQIHIPGVKRWVLRMVPPEPLPIARPLKGLPATALENLESVRTVPDLLLRSAYRYHDKAALRTQRMGRRVRYTYGEVLSLSRVVGHELRSSGVRRGGRVVLWAENQPEWGISYFGIVGLGATAVPLDYQTPPKEVWSLAAFTKATAILTTEERARSLRRARPDSPEASEIQLLNLHAWGAPFGASPEIADRDEETERKEIDPEALASIIFTSGTTLAPKGVCLTHRNLVSNVLSVSQALHPLETDEFLSILPLHHALEFTGGFLTALFGGGTITYLETLNAAAILGTMKETGTTVVIAVPRLLEVFWNRVEEQVPKALQFAWADEVCGARKHFVPLLRALLGRRLRNRFGGRARLFVVGGAALSPEIWKGFERLGIPVCEGYGLTETAPVVTVNPLEKRAPACVGPPVPDVEVRIVGPDERGVGEILVRGPNVMQGYLEDPERNARVFEEDWFKTGDFGFLDGQGALHIVGRVDDLIVTPAGKNVHPDEVEILYQDIPGVKEFCVLGVATKQGKGKEIHAVVVPQDEPTTEDTPPLEETIQAAIAERSQEIPTHHRIQRVHFRREELPKSATFKVKRSALQKELEAGLEAEGRPSESAPTDQCSRQVAEAVARICKTSPAMINLTDRLQTDLAVDSLMRVDLAADLEHRFGAKIPDDRVEAWETVGDIVADIRGRTER